MTEQQDFAWEPSRYRFTRAEIVQVIKHMHSVFDMVRLVDPSTGAQWELGERDELVQVPYRCWMAWNKNSRCAHCVSNQAVTQKERAIKFEFMNEGLHHVTAKYVEMDGTPFSMEMISKVPDDTIMEGYGKRDIVDAITRHNRRVYSDPLTGAYNRRYLDEMHQGEACGRAVAIIDADNFKRVNDSYGHGVGDQVLKGIVESITSCIRGTDAVVRYGGDEFVIIFDGLPENQMSVKLEQIRHQVLDLMLPDVPGHRQTVSIGGAYGDGTVRELLMRADKMLYQAKDAGKNCTRIEVRGEVN